MIPLLNALYCKKLFCFYYYYHYLFIYFLFFALWQISFSKFSDVLCAFTFANEIDHF